MLVRRKSPEVYSLLSHEIKPVLVEYKIEGSKSRVVKYA